MTTELELLAQRDGRNHDEYAPSEKHAQSALSSFESMRCTAFVAKCGGVGCLNPQRQPWGHSVRAVELDRKSDIDNSDIDC
jgi:hypothetical protein